jgi:hypothetical protein
MAVAVLFLSNDGRVRFKGRYVRERGCQAANYKRRRSLNRPVVTSEHRGKSSYIQHAHMV